jgi:hypothetical protein
MAIECFTGSARREGQMKRGARERRTLLLYLLDALNASGEADGSWAPTLELNQKTR